MKNYSEMSDFEINKLVAIYLGVKPRKTISFICQEKDIYPDYCNNPSDAWPIIVENKICINNFCKFGWCSDSEHGDYVYHDNPLRAAMIVYLMMKDGENA